MKSYNGKVRFTFQISRQFLIHTEKKIKDIFLMYIQYAYRESYYFYDSKENRGVGVRGERNEVNDQKYLQRRFFAPPLR